MTFEEALTRNHVRYKRSGAELQICCLFCHEHGETVDTRFRLWINTGTGAGICYNCRWRSRHAIAAVLRRLKVVDTVQETLTGEEVVKEPVVLPKDFTLLRNSDDIDCSAIRYLTKRGVTADQIKRKRIGISYTGKLAYRIVFPVFAQGKLVGYTARAFLSDKPPKYLHSTGSKYLYNFDPKRTTAVLSEGVFKALRLEQAVTGATSAALLGHSLTPIQMEQLRDSAVEEIILYPDPDGAGRMGMFGIGEELITTLKRKVKIVWPVAFPADDLILTIDNLSALVSTALDMTWRTQRLLETEE